MNSMGMDFKTFVIGLVACFLLSFAIGVERQVRRRNIGLRTMILVAVGSYVFVSFTFLIRGTLGTSGYTMDLTRIAAQVVAGIGFLGAGVIIKDSSSDRVKGLTTAATLWCDAGLGILCAGNFIMEACVLSALVLFSNIVLRYVNVFINRKVEEKNTVEEYLLTITDIKKPKEVIDGIINAIDTNKRISLKNYEISKDSISLSIYIKKNNEMMINKYIKEIVNKNNIESYKFDKLKEELTNDFDEEL